MKVVDNTCSYMCCQKQRVFLYSSSNSCHLFSIQNMFIFQTTKKYLHFFFTTWRFFFSRLEDKGNLRVVNIVQYQQHLHKTKILSSNHSSWNTPNRCCCCKKYPNSGDMEKECFDRFQALFYRTNCF
jgi:hypothetical protein